MLGLAQGSFLAESSVPFHLSKVDNGALALWMVIGVAILALVYGAFLAMRILGADQGTKTMQDIAKAIQEGANAYLKRQFTTVAFLVVILAVIIFGTAYSL